MSQFKLGAFDFIDLTVPVGLKERIARDVRSGVDGVTFWQTGQRGEPFLCESFVDVASLAAAEALLTEYHNAVGGDPLEMLWGGSLVHGVRFLVLDVLPHPRGMHAILQGIGGTAGTSQAVLRALWLLEAIDPTQDTPPAS